MAINSTEVAYSFGQMGSVLITGTSAVTSNGVAGMEKAVFCAITFLEDTEFDTAGLIAEDKTMYVNSDTAQTGISAASDDTDSETFPEGVTIYGRWTSITLDSGKVIAYIGY
jgi:aspartate oxidase